jgi:hypothetical protein
MEDLNQFAISRVLGGTMKHIKRPRFGPLGLLHVQHQVLAQFPRRTEQIEFTPSAVKIIARAFEETRKGYAVDRVLADPEQAREFFKRCHKLGVKAPEHAIALRLFRIRKSPGHGARIARATAPRENRDFSPFLFAAEMASAQIRYLYGASIDDIMAYPEIGGEFDRLAAKIRPGWTPLDYRLAALHVRKSQYIDKEKELPLFEKILKKPADKTVAEYGPLSGLNLRNVEKTDGIIGLLEKTRSSRFLYIATAKSVQDAVIPFTKIETFAALGNSFWSPSLASIHLVVFGIHEFFEDAPQATWAKKLVREKTPVFNMPIHFNADAA